MKFTSYHVVSILAAALASAAGCTQAPPPEFRLNMVQVATNEVSEPYEVEIANVLGAMFGTPDNPQVLPETGLDQQKLMLSAGPAWTGADDLTHGLYRRHCVHCHGISGDGRGPTARFLDPYPRDYRKGVFKFKSTYAAAKPTDADLTLVLHNGIPGTSMPSFSLLPKSEVESLVEYVKYLALRGEMETKLIAYVAENLGEEDVVGADGAPVKNPDGTTQTRLLPLNPAADAEQAAAIKDELTALVESWQGAKEQVIVPVEDEIPADNRTPEEVAASTLAGRELFFGKKANCFSCHGPTALGDGQQTDFDDWNKDIVNLANLIESQKKSLEALEAATGGSDEEVAERDARIKREEGLLAMREDVYAEAFPKRNAIPRNLRQGIYRGGRRRIDLFYRIHAGIKGVPMPGLGATSPGGPGTLKETEIWQIVDYVLSLPYEIASGPNQERPRNEGAITQ